MGHKAARWYARELGFNVLPGEGRRPLVSWPKFDRPPNEERLALWWRRFPDADVDWLVGDRFAVLDVDVRETFDGHDSLHELERSYYPLPDTPRALTPRGGVHIVFRVPDGTMVSPGDLAPGVDLRTGKRIIALPPGEGREWEIAPHELDMAELPDWVIALARRQPVDGYGGAGRGLAEKPRQPVAHGQRHYYLKDRATRFARGGIVEARELEVLLEAEFKAFCVPDPPPEPGSIRALAQWTASRSRIARREREAARWLKSS